MKRLSQKHQPGSHIGFMFDPINHTSRHAQLPHTPHVGHSIAYCRKSFTNTLSQCVFAVRSFKCHTLMPYFNCFSTWGFLQLVSYISLFPLCVMSNQNLLLDSNFTSQGSSTAMISLFDSYVDLSLWVRPTHFPSWCEPLFLICL